ncbi:MAG: flavodoxin family protein [Alphaproteobacteria bacterium]|nr:flavodoxin family protein [Alphaproteobacteria bacterium]
MTQITTIFFSGYGHTTKQAEAVHEGAGSVEGVKNSLIAIDKEGNVSEADWALLEKSDAIIFGSPTYMGGPAWQFKKFADASSKPWFSGKWKDKVAAGFSNSASINGDKFNTITYFVTLAMQHGMVWIGTGLMPANKKENTRNDVNYLAGFTGALAQSPSDASPEEGPLPGDLETARIFGKRIAEYTKRTAK